MGLTVKERGETVATWRAVQVRLMEMLAAWVPTTPEMEAKLLFGAHIWDVAEHADALGKRTHELRLPLQFSQPPVAAYVDLLQAVTEATETARRIAGFYDVLLPAQSARFQQYLERTDMLLDAPTVRIIKRIVDDESRMIRESQELRAQLAGLRLGDSDWVQLLAAREAAIDSIVLPQQRAPAVTAAQ
jgi:hypothetical protein